jgi:YHS domain-containing protein
MTFIARMLRYLFWMVVVSWAFALLRRLVKHMGNAPEHANRPVDVPSDAVSQKLVRDPVCGMHIAEGLALPLKQGSTILHFCSAECRDKFLNETRKFAANA